MSRCGSYPRAAPRCSASRDELANGTSGEKPWEIYGYAKRIPLKGLAPGRYVLRIEAAVRGKDGAPATREAPITILP